MSEITVKVPADHVAAIRDISMLYLYSALDSASDLAQKCSPKSSESEVAKLKSELNRALELERVLDELGWQDGSARDLELTADADLIAGLVRGAITDVGGDVHGEAENVPLDVGRMDELTGLLQRLTRMLEGLPGAVS